MSLALKPLDLLANKKQAVAAFVAQGYNPGDILLDGGYINIPVSESKTVQVGHHTIRCHIAKLTKRHGPFIRAAKYMRMSEGNVYASDYYGCNVDDKQVYIYFEYIPMRLVQFQLHILKCFVKSMLEGLKYMKDQMRVSDPSLSICHRNLSIENVFLASNGVFKFAKYGFEITKEDSAVSCKEYKKLYLSPETLEFELNDEYTDIWSIGVLAYEFSEDYPFAGFERVCGLIFHIVNSDISALKLKQTDNPVLQDFIDMCTVRDTCIALEESDCYGTRVTKNRGSIEKMLEHPFVSDAELRVTDA